MSFELTAFDRSFVPENIALPVSASVSRKITSRMGQSLDCREYG